MVAFWKCSNLSLAWLDLYTSWITMVVSLLDVIATLTSELVSRGPMEFLPYVVFTSAVNIFSCEGEVYFCVIRH